MAFARLLLTANRINKYEPGYTLLDAGCRTMDLKPLLKGCGEYYGSDLIPKKGVLQCDLEEKLPFKDNEFDVVTALDVLEHLDNPHGALQELMRVARKSVLVSLPNMYHVSFRTSFLLGAGISGKYCFDAEPVLDRHRWILSYDEAINFIQENTKSHKVDYENILSVRGRAKLIREPIDNFLAKLWPNLFVYGVLFEITLNK